MKPVDMSDKAVTARLKRVSQLRRLCLSLQRAKLPAEANTTKANAPEVESTKPVARKNQ